MKDMLVTFVRERNKRTGCVVACSKNGIVTLGWSKCMLRPTSEQRKQGLEPDSFDPDHAIDIAKVRANINLSDKIDEKTTPRIPAICRKALRNMADRAKRYFKKNKSKG